MPKKYILKTDEELAQQIRKQLADDGTAPIDWAHEAAIEDIKRFFVDDKAAGKPQQEPRPGGSEG